ncbi:NUDIX hydrolase [Jatrophihabitans telluris]|uniref:NUDIX hydrolase n=1 Tax=Jatrophihabitans telluris TaxID=2038343 RepID=A0ABY4R4R1_9ACTN|nr:NUDIX domain-containing protein [Jatrophihabitans telluris]UQX89955.1 NUDIX hydrolase [Jatrophihabitans telluris]
MSGPSRPPAQTAAGGVVWRGNPADPRIALVHRPRYDDWTLPKGKLQRDEHPLAAAVREVYEETGALVATGRRLTRTEYSLQDSSKRVTYWAMHYVSGEHTPSREVDRLLWLPVAEANDLLTYALDRTVLADFVAAPLHARTVVLMRHAKAGKRSQYSGDDRQRPLDKIGRRQARDAVAVLSAFAPQRILSADRVRCEQTVEPVAHALGLLVDAAPEFSDEAYLSDPDPGLRRVADLSRANTATLICSQGAAIPALLSDLGLADTDPPCRKGSIWVLSLVDDALVSADYYPHPGR